MSWKSRSAVYIDESGHEGNGITNGMPGEDSGRGIDSLLRKYMPVVTFVFALTGLALAIAALAIAVDNKGYIDDVKDLSDGVRLSTKTVPSSNGYTNAGQLWAGTGTWVTKTPLPEPRSDFAIVNHNQTIYLIGGLNATGDIISSVLKYDPYLHTYEELTPLPAPRFRHGAAGLADEIYVIGGFETHESSNTGQPEDCLLIYSISSNQWRDGPCTEVPHGDTCMSALDGKLYVIGGYGKEYEMLDTVEVYNPATKRWNRVPDMPGQRGDVMCAAVGHEIFAIGGFDGSSFSSSVFSYNPSTQKWTEREPLPYNVGDGAVTALPDNKILVISGETTVLPGVNKAPLHWTQEYYPELDIWVDKAPITNARFRTGAAEVNGIVYVFGGHQVCDTDEPGNDDRVCHELALDSVEAFLDVEHHEPLTIFVKE